MTIALGEWIIADDRGASDNEVRHAFTEGALFRLAQYPLLNCHPEPAQRGEGSLRRSKRSTYK